MNLKKLVAGAAVATTLVVGVAGVSYAADNSPSATAPKVAATKSHKRHPVLHMIVKRQAFATVLSLTHTNAQQLKAGLKSGQTIGQYATAHGSSAQAVTDALVQKFSTELHTAATSGKLNATQAGNLNNTLAQRVERFVNRTWTHA